MTSGFQYSNKFILYIIVISDIIIADDYMRYRDHLLLSTCISVNGLNKAYPYSWPYLSGGFGSLISKLINFDSVLARVF